MSKRTKKETPVSSSKRKSSTISKRRVVILKNNPIQHLFDTTYNVLDLKCSQIEVDHSSKVSQSYTRSSPPLPRRTDQLLKQIITSADYDELKDFHSQISEERMALSIEFYELSNDDLPTQIPDVTMDQEGKDIKNFHLAQSMMKVIDPFDGDVLNAESEENPKFVQIRHPSSGNAATFLFSGDNKRVLEVLQFSDSKRSYFIDDSVSSDGDLYFCTPIDPLFLVLPYLIKTKRCCPLDQTLVDEEFPEVGRVVECSMDVSLIADRRGDESLNAFIYNEEKTLLWLQTKLERLMVALKQKNINTSKSVAISANFVKNDEDEDSGVNYIRYAYGMILDYIPEELGPKFAEFIKLPPEPEKANKRKEIVSPSQPVGKKSKLDDEDEDHYESKPPVPKVDKKTPSLKEQKLAKAAKGSKSISSFFMKK